MKACKFFLLGIILVGISGCITETVHLTQPSKSYKPTKHVAFLTKNPSRPYKIIAIIKADGSPNRKQSLVLKKIQKRAQQIGAQAIFALNSNLTYFSPPPDFDTKPIHSFDSVIRHIFSGSGGYRYDLKVAAIRYTDSKKENETWIWDGS